MFEIKNTGFGTNLIFYYLSVIRCKPMALVQLYLIDKHPFFSKAGS
jgi:hypothetical protein